MVVMALLKTMTSFMAYSLYRAKELFRPLDMSPEELERAIRDVYQGGPTSSGVQVSSDSAMRLATVYSCVNVLARTLGQLPCHLYRKNGREREKADDHILYRLLHDQPNEWMTAPEHWNMIMNHLALRGNYFALKNRTTLGRVIEIIPLAPGIVQEVVQNKNWSLNYKCRFPDGSQFDVPGSEIMHLRGMVVNGYLGVNPIQYVRESIGMGLAAEEFGARYFGSGTHPGIVVEHPYKIGPEAQKNLQNSLMESYSGLGKAHRLLLLEEGMKFQKITIDPRDAQFLELRQYQRSEIVDIFFGMPLSLLNGTDSTPTYASAEQFSLDFVIYALMPWLANIEAGIKRDLLQPEERATLYPKFQAAGLLRGDIKSRFEAYQIAINSEIICPNEARELEEMNPYVGGDEFRTRTSTVKNAPSDSGAGGNAS